MPAAVAKLNEKPMKDSLCAFCGAVLESVRTKPGITQGRVDTDFQPLYFCINENCKHYGMVTVLYKYGSGTPEPKIADL
jgi:hypothetical protein